LEKWKESLHDFNAAISLAPKSGAFYENRAIVKSNLGDKAGAMSDIATAQSLGHQIDPEIIQMLQQ
jgi:Flp pilus assembly protein TadD